MALSYPKLKLPDSAETLAFQAVETILTTDPLLQSTVRSWHSWKGASEDILMPTFASCPYVRISPAPEASRRVTEIQHQMPLDVLIEAAVAGSDKKQIFNFWGAIRSALFPVDPGKHARVLSLANGANITRAQMTANGYRPIGQRDDPGLRMWYAQGTLQLILLVLTP